MCTKYLIKGRVIKVKGNGLVFEVYNYQNNSRKYKKRETIKLKTSG